MSANDDFVIGQKADPKYLIIYLQKCLLNDNEYYARLFRWTKVVKFTHRVGWSTSTHDVIYPEQVNLVFTVEPRSNIKVDQYDIAKSFENYMNCSDFMIKGFCERCNKECDGKESIMDLNLGSFAAFPLTSSNLSCNLRDMQKITACSYEFQLVSVICRQELSRNSDHNYAFCKEGDQWIVYNDNHINPLSDWNITGAYIFIFRVAKII